MSKSAQYPDPFVTPVILPANVEYELDLKFFEYANLGLPLADVGYTSSSNFRTAYCQRGQGVIRRRDPECHIDEMKREFGKALGSPEARWSKPLRAFRSDISRAFFMSCSRLKSLTFAS
ncbi:hypothetical protein M378DRAFT_920190 [Amanita muscaria Koide BX008]|uniref:Uncharacterized protein n=1 Tax=Amanita muscaria (strain Koide BX008) TaxID=946122 RepID=A0A0C2WUG2_AMAMK|nr:hypothetical protein M378DRAFT_920190 [Amanita muscaria Koide BX008]